MSGEAFNAPINEQRIRELAPDLAKVAEAVADSLHIVAWAEAGDTARRKPEGDDAEHRLYERWLALFTSLYGDY